MPRPLVLPSLAVPLLALLLAGCRAEAPAPPPPQPTAQAAEADDGAAERALAANLERLLAYADSIEAALRPVALLTPAQVRAFGRFNNAAQLAVARRLGVPQPVTEAARARLLEEGRLVPLEDSEFWVVRRLEHSAAFVTPEVVALLEEIGRRFQARLDALGLPALRFEVTSVLRTAEDQARLRRTNPNAARGVSTHQFGTTVDVAYSSFRAPLEPVVELDTRAAPWLEPYLRQVERLAAETGASRMARELEAELGHVLREMQDEGRVMVTMEVRQPVFHMTVAGS